MAEPSTRPQELEPYKRAGMELVPLHRWDERIVKGGKEREIGKAPKDAGWRRRQYPFEQCLAHMRAGNNVGMRLRPIDLVVDVDRRNWPAGRDVLAEFVAQFGLELDRYPHVITGSDGDHFHMRKPADVRVRSTLPDFPGIELKSHGVQVVAAGSVHPNGRNYRWDDFAPSLSDGAPEAPERLLSMFRIPTRPPTEGGGELEPERLEELLSNLDPREFRDHDRWLRLMMASHHATGGAGMDEFLDWSASDPQYASRRQENARRWDSLHAQGASGTVGVGTLYRELVLAGKPELVPRTDHGEDFADDLPPEDKPEGEADTHRVALSWLHELNKDHWAVNEDGKFVVYHKALDVEGRVTWQRSSRGDFENLHCNRTVEKKTKGTDPLGKAWIEWPRRRTARGVCFEPERDMPGWLNLWQGWALEPRKGDWSLTQELVRDVICGKSDELERYVLDWIAFLFQHPAQQPEVAVVMRGDKGTGKSTLGRTLCRVAGHHGLHIANPGLLTGRFNSHLRGCIVLFADEAFWAGDKQGEGQLKQLITEPRIMFEGKGQNAVSDVNLVHLVIASNESWVIPAGINGERRFLMLDVNTSRQGDKAFFRDLNRQLEQGGLQAMLYDGLTRDIGGWHPRDRIPNTAALVEQKERTLTGLATWWLETLRHGTLHRDWRKGRVEVFTQDVQNSLTSFLAEAGIKRDRRSVGTQLGMELKKLVPRLGTSRAQVPTERMDVETQADGRANVYAFPPLKDCREFFARQLLDSPGYDWADDEMWLG